MKVQCHACKRVIDAPDNGTQSESESESSCPHCHAPIGAAGSAEPGTPPRDLLDDLLEELHALEALQPVTAAGPAVQAGPLAPPGAHFPRRESRAYAEDRPAYRGQLIAVIIGFFIVVLAGYFAFRTIRTGLHSQAVRAAIRSADSEKASLRQLLQSGHDLRAANEYKAALEAYRRVATRARPLLDRLGAGIVHIKPGPLREEAEAARKELTATLGKAMEGLDVPEVKFGAQGLVDFDGDWVTPEQKKAMFEEKMRAEGRRQYRGEWLTEDEVHERKGEVRYKGRWVTKAMRDRLVAAEKKQETTPPAATVPRPAAPPRPRAKDVARKYRADAPQWILDDFEGSGHRWANVPWENANPCRLSVVSGSASGRLKIALQGGAQDKSAIVRPIALDFRTRTRIRMDIFNDCGEPLRAAIALQTNSYYESRWQSLRIGENKNVMFDLTVGDYKCAVTHWSPAARIAKMDSVGYLYILFYNREGEVLLDNIVALGGG